jgi:uncharacterized protein YcaQ
MPATTPALPRIPNKAARAIFLDRHGLGRRTPPGGLLGLIEQLGFVQIDSIATVERAHHMILSARSRTYRPKHLKRLLEHDRSLFEHWTHDAAAIPSAYFPYWKMRFARDAEDLRTKWRTWRRDGFEEKFGEVLARVHGQGACMAREVGDGETRSSGGWWDWHPSKTALEFLWRTGALSVCRRDGFQKVFDLTERVIPEAHLAPTPSPEKTIDWACAGALDRLGFATSGELAKFWATVTPAEAKSWCAAQNGQRLIEAELEGADGQWRKTYACPSVLEQIETPPDLPGGIRVLSPFDPALRDRNRAERMFGFHYRIEIFVPAAKRTYGYYVFPVLERDRLIGRIDMKRVPEEGVLNVTAFWPEEGITMGKGRLSRLETELSRIARFAGCTEVSFANNWLRSGRRLER